MNRDDMDPRMRAVSDALDELLWRHFQKVASSSHPDDFLAFLEEQGYEVAPLGGWA